MSSGRSGRLRHSSQKGLSSQALICCAIFVASSCRAGLTQPSSPLSPAVSSVRGSQRVTEPPRSNDGSRAGWPARAGPRRPWPSSAITRSTTARMGGEERKLRSMLRSRKSCSAASACAREPGAGDVEALRIGALEAEDRLLVVADGEDRARAARGAFAGEIFPGQRPDDVPLALVRVLRLVDQDMVGLLVELVAHPFAHAGGRAAISPPRG